MTLWGTVAALQTSTSPGHDPVPLEAVEPILVPNLHQLPDLHLGIRGLYQKCQFYDIFLRCGRDRFPAHKVALAAQSSKLCDVLRQLLDKHDGNTSRGCEESEAPLASEGAPSQLPAGSGSNAVEEPASRYPELPLEGVTHPEAVRALLDFVYGLSGEYHVSSDEVNKDVLRLSQAYELPLLEENASRRLLAELTSRNVVERLATCEEFKLDRLWEQMVDLLVASAEALREVAASGKILEHPRLLQGLLVRAAQRHDSPSAAAGTQKQKCEPFLVGEVREMKRAKTADAAVTGGA